MKRLNFRANREPSRKMVKNLVTQTVRHPAFRKRGSTMNTNSPATNLKVWDTLAAAKAELRKMMFSGRLEKSRLDELHAIIAACQLELSNQP